MFLLIDIPLLRIYTGHFQVLLSLQAMPPPRLGEQQRATTFWQQWG